MMHHQRSSGGPPLYQQHSSQSGGPQNVGRPYVDNSHHQRLPQYPGGPPVAYPPYYRQPFMPQRPQGYMGPMGPGVPTQRPQAPQNNLAAVFQNVQQKVGTG